MEELLHHLECINPVNSGNKLPTSTGAGFLSHQQYNLNVGMQIRVVEVWAGRSRWPGGQLCIHLDFKREGCLMCECRAVSKANDQ